MLQPIHSDLSCDSFEEEPNMAQDAFNKSIFRQSEDSGVDSPPLVRRANPIGYDDESMEDTDIGYQMHFHISPYPYDMSREEVEDRRFLSSRIDLSLPNDSNWSREPPSRGLQQSVDFSCYFKPLPYREMMDDSRSAGDSSEGDDFPHGFVSFGEAYGILNSSSTQTEACNMQGRFPSPAQVSIGSESDSVHYDY